MKNAGYTIEEVEPVYEEFEYYFGIALGHNEKTGMWVTWCFKKSIKNENEIDFFWGHYFDRRSDAIIDYHTRIIGEYRAR